MLIHVTQRPLVVRAIWTIKERHVTPISHRDVWVPVFQDHNLLTYDGLTQLAAFYSGSGSPPGYLVIDDYSAQLQNAGTLAVSSTSISLDKIIDETGDTEIILGVGTANQETVTKSARSGTGPYTYTISATTKTHTHLDYCVRKEKIDDVIGDIQDEVQYSPTVFPGKRSPLRGFYSTGNGNGTMQFMLTGSQANVRFESLGLSESDTVGAGLLHNHLAVGYDHSTTGIDVEIDVSIDIANA
jgi:hypothetical protein